MAVSQASQTSSESGQSGAQASYRGYRLQLLYTLERLLTADAAEGLTFQPEGREDLAVRDAGDRLIEVIQVKSYASLTLSDLAPDKPDSFLHRAVRYLESETPPAIRLVNYGSFGPEIRGAWKGVERDQNQVTRKLLPHGFSRESIERLFTRIQLVAKDELESTATAHSTLQQSLTAGDPATAFDLLNFWLFRIAEQRQVVTSSILLQRLAAVGRFLAEQASHHREWYTVIEPLIDRPLQDEERAELQAEFYAGVQTRYEHILADLDFRRDAKLTQIADAFLNHRVVIVHAASGQGKNTLAYRYLQDAFPSHWRFAIHLIEDRRHALSIARALAGHAAAMQAPMAVYIDVSHRDLAWTDLVKQLQRYPELQVLVTIREEDFRRANVSGAEFDFTPVELSFDEEEARLIFERAVAIGASTAFLDFAEAWDRFGGQGPLMEFVYLLTQTVTLEERLREQVNRLRDRVRCGVLGSDELHLLRLVAVASALEARLDVRHVVGVLNLPEPTRTLELFEKEYLIRRSADQCQVEGLHPIRSSILTALLSDPVIHPWLDTAIQLLPIIVEADLEGFLLHALVEHIPERVAVAEAAMLVQIQTWTGLAGILRALLWLSVAEYVKANQPCVEAAHAEFGDGWNFVMDLDFGGIVPQEVKEWWKRLDDLIPSERQARFDSIRRMQEDPRRALDLVAKWLSELSVTPQSPKSDADWSGLALIGFWAGHLQAGTHICDLVSDDELDRATATLSLEAIADLATAFHAIDPPRHAAWLERNQQTLDTRLAEDYRIVSIERQPDLLRIHFMPFWGSDETQHDRRVSGDSSDPLHGETMERIRLVRKLYPGHGTYHSEGYGYRFGSMKSVLDDSTTKHGIPAASLAFEPATALTSVGYGVGAYRFRPNTWDEYVERLLQRRQMVIASLDQLQRGLIRYLERDQGFNVWGYVYGATKWYECESILSQSIPLPKSAVDPWGLAWESMSDEAVGSLEQRPSIPRALILQKYKPFYRAQRDHCTSLYNFFSQAPHVMLRNAVIGKRRDDDPERQRRLALLQRQGANVDTAHLSTMNLAAARDSLRTFQAEFRQLLGHRRLPASLEQLEQTEHDLLASIWQYWYFFANRPWHSCANPRTQIRNSIALSQRVLGDRIGSALMGVDRTGRASVMQVSEAWGSTPSIWIRLDVDDPIALYECLQRVLSALATTLAPIDFNDLEYYIIDQSWRYVAILPMIRGRMLAFTAWKLHTFGTVRKGTPGEGDPWLYVPQAIPDDVLPRLGIELWQFQDLSLANQLSEQVATLSLMAAQLADLARVPALEEPGLRVVQEELNRRAQLISTALQAAYDTMAAMLDRFNALSTQEIGERGRLQEAIGAITEMAGMIKPTNAETQSHLVTLDQFAEYAKRLEQARSLAEAARLLWVSDVLTAA